jgi:tetratricopeptide (TPR) repeat protein
MEAIKDRGLVLGTALAADRLMRCNSRAWRWYARNDKGRLVDSPGGEGWRKEPLRVPGWLLPPVERTAVPESLQGYADFADALEGENDCWRAATEYKRIAFLGESPDLAFWAQMRIGACYFRNEEWTESATEFVSAADLAPGSQARNAAWLAAASSHFNLGGYESCRQVLLEAPFDWSPRLGQSVAGEGGTTADSSGTYSSVTLEDWLGLAGLCAMALGDWDQAQSRFAEAAQRSSASPDRSRLLLLAERARDGAHLPRKNAGLAAAMSAVLPGSGQVYCGRYYDGFRHFMFNSLLISIVYGLVRDESYPGAYLVAGLALPFYLGNVAGAKKAAVWTNAARREAYLRDSAALTESTGE